MVRPGYSWTAIQRWKDETDWSQTKLVLECGPEFIASFEEVLRSAASDNGLSLVSVMPEIGWLRKLPSGQEAPCGEHTDGARPVWIWWAK